MTLLEMRRLGAKHERLARARNPWALAAALSLGLTAGCEEERGEVTIGLVQSFSGPLSKEGAKAEIVSEVALQDINAAGGVLGSKLVFSKQDDRNDPDVAAEVARSFADDGVQVIVGAISSRVTTAMLDVTVPAGQLVVSGMSEAVSVTPSKCDGLFYRTGMAAVPMGILTAEAAAAEGTKKLAIIASDNRFTAALADATQKRFAELDCGGARCEVARVDYPSGSLPENLHFGALINDLMATEAPDGFLLASYPADAALLIHELEALGYAGTYFTTSEAANGRIDKFVTAAASERVKWLVSDLPERPGAEYVYDALAEAGLVENRALPESLAIYDAIFVTALAIEKAGTTDARKVAEVMKDVANAPGEPIYAGEFAKAKDLIAAGKDIDYSGAFTTVEFLEFGGVEIRSQFYTYRDGNMVPLE